MTLPIIKRPRARMDMLDTYFYLAPESEKTAERFLDCALQTMQHIADAPMLGAIRDFPNANLQGLRSRRVDGFSNWLIFYLVRPDAIEIVRVLHGARDLERIFSDSADDDRDKD